MARASRRSSNAISLFPFLAVLMCTMGALIFLLIVTSRNLRNEAVERRARSAAPASIVPDETIVLGGAQAAPFEERSGVASVASVDPDAELRRSIENLRRVRDERQEEHDDHQKALLAAQRRVRDVETQSRNLDRRIEDVRSERRFQTSTLEALRREQSALAGQLAKTEGRVLRASQERSAAPSRFAIVPYDGKTGTSRRPILLEFTGEGVRFVAEDILLTKEDLAGFTLNYNPLLAGTRALVEYWTAKSRASGGTEPLPYVLMIVRPDGARMYPARLFLGSLDEMTGYELLAEDQELALPPTDPEALAACRAAIERVLRERGDLLHDLAEKEAGDRLGTRYRFGSDGFRPADEGAGSLIARGGSLYDRGIGAGSGGSGTQGTGTGPPGTLTSSAPGSGASTGAPTGSGAEIGGLNSGGDAGGPSSQDGSSSQAGGRRGAGPPGGTDDWSPVSRSQGTGTSGEATNSPQRGAGDANHTGSTAGGSSAASADSGGQPALDMFWYRRQFARTASQQRLMRRWGLSDPHSTIGFERDVTIEVHADRVIVGTRDPIAVPEDRTDHVLVERVLIALDEHVTTWGHPPEKFYWVPSVRFVVHPGASATVERLNGALREWNLSTRMEHKQQ